MAGQKGSLTGRCQGCNAVQLADALEASWPAIARPNQLPPPGDWQVWLLLAGRGFGKTRTLAEWVCQQAGSGQAGRIALVAATAADARDVLVEGQSGILAVSPPWFRPVYEPSKRRLTWPNGAMATTFSAEEPERLRGPQHDAAVCDELGAWSRPETWDMLQFGLRLGRYPRCLVATTPRPTRLIRELLARFAADLSLEQIRSLDAGTGFNARFAGTRVPTLAEAVDWAKREEMGVFVEIKEAERLDLAVDRVRLAPEGGILANPKPQDFFGFADLLLASAHPPMYPGNRGSQRVALTLSLRQYSDLFLYGPSPEHRQLGWLLSKGLLREGNRPIYAHFEIYRP